MSSTVGAAKTAAAKAAKERKEAARTIQVQGEIVSTGSILNLETFLETRKFEIHALLSAMKSSKYAGKKLKFQTLPRRLRRRTASYNPKRIPKNVRHIALKETAMAVLQKEKLRKRRQRLLKTRRAHKVAKLKYEKRQTKVRWLETHIWHTKRCKMGYLWGYSLVISRLGL